MFNSFVNMPQISTKYLIIYQGCLTDTALLRKNMLPAIGFMIGFYIITRMIENVLKKDAQTFVEYARSLRLSCVV